MDLKQQLIDYGCGSEFIEIALGYAQFYDPSQDFETFIEYVEEEHAKVEAKMDEVARQSEIIDATSIVSEFIENDNMED